MGTTRCLFLGKNFILVWSQIFQKLLDPPPPPTPVPPLPNPGVDRKLEHGPRVAGEGRGKAGSLEDEEVPPLWYNECQAGRDPWEGVEAAGLV